MEDFASGQWVAVQGEVDVPGVSCGLFAAEVLEDFEEAHFACLLVRLWMVVFWRSL